MSFKFSSPQTSHRSCLMLVSARMVLLYEDLYNLQNREGFSLMLLLNRYFKLWVFTSAVAEEFILQKNRGLQLPPCRTHSSLSWFWGISLYPLASCPWVLPLCLDFLSKVIMGKVVLLHPFGLEKQASLKRQSGAGWGIWAPVCSSWHSVHGQRAPCLPQCMSILGAPFFVVVLLLTVYRL